MASYSFNSTNTEKKTMNDGLVLLKAKMDERIPVWKKLTDEQKKKVILNDKDLILSKAWDVYKYLKNNFFGDQRDG